MPAVATVPVFVAHVPFVPVEQPYSVLVTLPDKYVEAVLISQIKKTEII